MHHNVLVGAVIHCYVRNLCRNSIKNQKQQKQQKSNGETYSFPFHIYNVKRLQ